MYDLVVLGGGSGGLNVAAMAARVGAKVALIEKSRLGGECTHSACVPSKALIRASQVLKEIREAGRLGIHVGAPEADFGAVMARVRSVVQDFASGETAEALEAKGIEVHFGSPAFGSYDTVVLDGQARFVAQKFVIATGSSPARPPIPGLDRLRVLDNTTIWGLSEAPGSLAIIGAGPVGIEIGQAMARLGVPVTVVADSQRILPAEDPEVSDFVHKSLEAQGIRFLLGVTIDEVRAHEGRKLIHFTHPGGVRTDELPADEVFVAAGRVPNVEGLNLGAAGIRHDPARGIEVDAYLRTSNHRVYAIGDVNGHHLWTHAAEREAAVAFQNAVLRLPKKIDYSAMPWATFTDPEVATVGISEADAAGRDGEARTFRAEFARVDRARIDGLTAGFAKVVATPSGRILGATIVGEDAGLLLQEFVLAMEHGLSLGDLAQTVHIYPTYSGLTRELANQFAATRLESGVVRSALRWFYGFTPRGGADNTTEPADATGSRSTARVNGHGH